MAGSFPERIFVTDVNSATSDPVVIGEVIPAHQIISRLELRGVNRSVRASILSSAWYAIDNGRMLLECRNPQVLSEPRTGITNIYDMDDCLLSATGWHQREYELLESNPDLNAQGVCISITQARDIYESSKVLVGKTVERQPRYTPRLNMVLLSAYATYLRGGLTATEAWSHLSTFRQFVVFQMQTVGEVALGNLGVDPLIEEIFMGNSPQDFVYDEFVRDLFEETGHKDIRMIATRGKIEGPLGQVDKVHRSGLIGMTSRQGKGLDGVVYSNDIKGEVLATLINILPEVRDRLIRAYDDNPDEVEPYLQVAERLGASNIEVVRIAHPDAKRKNVTVDRIPHLTYRFGGAHTLFSSYSGSPLTAVSV